MSIINRLKQPTPRFFKKIRNWALAAASVGAAVLASPVALPATLLTLAGYLTVAGTVAATVSQAVTGSDYPADNH